MAAITPSTNHPDVVLVGAGIMSATLAVLLKELDPSLRMHNGYFKSLKEVVHFYNTRDVLPVCKSEDPGEKVTCWPPPEDSTNLNRKQLGNLKLTDEEEDDVVAFLKTLTDDYQVSKLKIH